MGENVNAPLEVGHVRVRLLQEIGEQPGNLTSLDRNILVQASLHLEAILEPFAMPFPAVGILHEAYVPRETTAEYSVHVQEWCYDVASETVRTVRTEM